MLAIATLLFHRALWRLCGSEMWHSPYMVYKLVLIAAVKDIGPCLGRGGRVFLGSSRRERWDAEHDQDGDQEQDRFHEISPSRHAGQTDCHLLHASPRGHPCTTPFVPMPPLCLTHPSLRTPWRLPRASSQERLKRVRASQIWP